jgi:F-type H+-transporting ATPase subunit b
MRFCLLIGVVSTVLAVFSSAAARADQAVFLASADNSEEGGKEAAKGAPKEEHAHAQDGDDPFKGWLDLTIWTIVVFLILVGVLYGTAWKPIREGLDKREHDIARDKEEARAAREEAAALREQLQVEMQKAQEQVKGILDKARQDAEALANEFEARGKAAVQADRERLNRDMDLARDQALAQVWNEAATLAVLVSAKVLHRQLKGDDHRHLIDEALTELRQAAETRKRETQGVHV